MNHIRQLVIILLSGIVVTCFPHDSAAQVSNHLQQSASRPSVKIDGILGTNAGFTTAWKKSGSNPRMNITELLYFNDDRFLYIFLKCSPTVEQWFKENKSTGILAYLYVDADSNTKTGADKTGNGKMIGAEFQIWIPFAIAHVRQGGSSKKFTGVSYVLNSWDASEGEFSKEIRSEDVGEAGRLIADGIDGVELAIPLVEIGKQRGDRLDLISVDWANPSTHRTSVLLR